MAKREKLTPEQVVAALTATNGLAYLAADRLNVSAKTVYNYAAKYKVVAEALEHQKGKRLDTAEASLWNAILKGEAWAVCFYLKTQGKSRGYVERHEVAAAKQEVGADVRKRLGEVDGGGPGQPGEVGRVIPAVVDDAPAPAID